MFTFISISSSAVQNMIHFIYSTSFHFHHRIYYELAMADDLLSSWLDLLDGATTPDKTVETIPSIF